MKLSEYIQKLKDIEVTFGDLEVVDTYNNEPMEPEKDGEVLIIADEF